MTESPPIRKPLHSLGSLLGQYRFTLLFFFLLSTVMAFPYTEHTGFGSWAFRVLSALVIAFSVFVLSFRRGLLVVAILLAIPSVVQHIVRPRVTPGFFPLFNLTLSFAFDLWVVVTIFRRVFADVEITSETIFGALCIYLMNGLSFASVYEACTPGQPFHGHAIRSAITQSLRAARIDSSDLGHVNAHGLSTIHHDAAEAQAIRETIAHRADDQRRIVGVGPQDFVARLKNHLGIANTVPARAQTEIPAGCVTCDSRTRKGQSRYARQGDHTNFHFYPRLKVPTGRDPPTRTSDIGGVIQSKRARVFWREATYNLLNGLKTRFLRAL